MEIEEKTRKARVLSIMIIKFSPGRNLTRYSSSEIAGILNPNDQYAARSAVIAEADLFSALQERKCIQILCSLFPGEQIEFHRYSFENRLKLYGVSFKNLSLEEYPNGVSQLEATIMDKLHIAFQVLFLTNIHYRLILMLGLNSN
jgi:hypothetical protein